MDKLSKIFEEVSNECDGCKYFDIDSIYSNVEFDKPLYALVSKRRIGRLLYISPKEYIYRIANGFGSSYHDALRGYNGDVGAEYVKAMQKGAKFPVGYYTVDGSGQEGRHRAMAAMAIGVKIIPVMELSNIGRDEFITYVRQFKGKTFDELNQHFIKNGTKGITMLGYNDLKRFIDYNGDEIGEVESNPVDVNKEKGRK